MGHVQRSVVINAPAEEVFALMADTRRFDRWVYGFKGLDEGPETLSKGASFRWRVRCYGLTCKVASTVTRFDPPDGYAEEIRVSGLLRATMTKTIVRQKRRTQLSWSLTYRVVGGPLGVVADWLLGHRFANRAVTASLRGAKQLLETPKKAAPARQGSPRRQTAAR